VPLIALLALGCAPGESGPLVDDAAWALLPAADVFPAHAEAYRDCPLEDLGAFFPTADGLVVETGGCGYFPLETPALHDVAAGDRIGFTLAHGELVSADPGAEAHVALALGEDVVWEQVVAIPAGSDAVAIELSAPARADAGTPVRLHLHNHGQNQWALQDLRSTAAE
jgi:hypothetical protein